ncbi:TetR/AcrR family transcriptional regulator [Cryptosporangium phraense]|uniref:TetR family transcriptional regulator n=1 Tax=Cryptosporangium phraense TaxID=2593070 RepID=A0A545ADU7_9ACTN|nr:TetR/AcrR family transcriptional regulator [Cryptosporangium phraense]TQS39492.1 TetR family transcriptional regulator [Cryptosporangium phraense]
MRADAARNASAIVEAAGELFAERGPDVPIDEVARRAGVGNATLYRHFPTRSDLLVAVYGGQVAELCRQADDDLFEWLDAFVVHVSTARGLARAITDNPDGRRSALFEEWHALITETAGRLLVGAQEAGEVRADIGARDLLVLLSAVTVASTDTTHARLLLRILREGLDH